ncbi:translation initiation factor IF-2-like isoform X4 [Pseudoliparis swirei]|uniref:translation initiation factor IF-2-like isoform X4 n=1 Tax=Pseudoliparis swirei TaxID=2059687 RepID=UPI0024BE7F69|nr:translation initiation factor IF-2-like isoform X4 [Pseudoliparis swirei]
MAARRPSSPSRRRRRARTRDPGPRRTSTWTPTWRRAATSANTAASRRRSSSCSRCTWTRSTPTWSPTPRTCAWSVTTTPRGTYTHQELRHPAGAQRSPPPGRGRVPAHDGAAQPRDGVPAVGEAGGRGRVAPHRAQPDAHHEEPRPAGAQQVRRAAQDGRRRRHQGGERGGRGAAGAVSRPGVRRGAAPRPRLRARAGARRAAEHRGQRLQPAADQRRRRAAPRHAGPGAVGAAEPAELQPDAAPHPHQQHPHLQHGHGQQRPAGQRLQQVPVPFAVGGPRLVVSDQVQRGADQSLVLRPEAEARSQLDAGGGGGGAEEEVQRHGAGRLSDHHRHPRQHGRRRAAVHLPYVSDRGPAGPRAHAGVGRRERRAGRRPHHPDGGGRPRQPAQSRRAVGDRVQDGDAVGRRGARPGRRGGAVVLQTEEVQGAAGGAEGELRPPAVRHGGGDIASHAGHQTLQAGDQEVVQRHALQPEERQGPPRRAAGRSPAHQAARSEERPRRRQRRRLHDRGHRLQRRRQRLLAARRPRPAREVPPRLPRLHAAEVQGEDGGATAGAGGELPGLQHAAGRGARPAARRHQADAARARRLVHREEEDALEGGGGGGRGGRRREPEHAALRQEVAEEDDGAAALPEEGLRAVAVADGGGVRRDGGRQPAAPELHRQLVRRHALRLQEQQPEVVLPVPERQGGRSSERRSQDPEEVQEAVPRLVQKDTPALPLQTLEPTRGRHPHQAWRDVDARQCFSAGGSGPTDGRGERRRGPGT